jgi:hypothetical protein
MDIHRGYHNRLASLQFRPEAVASGFSNLYKYISENSAKKAAVFYARKIPQS